MKSILLSVRPQWTAKILNGEKTIEIRKTAPKCKLPVEVYIYCTKAKKRNDWLIPAGERIEKKNDCSGKVIAKFTLNKIERFINGMNELELEWDGKPDVEYDYFAYEKALEEACLTYEEADEYCLDQSFYAWHIENLEIFDKPKELDEFDYPNPSGTRYVSKRSLNGLPSKKHPPKSWCYVEEKE